MPSQTVLSRLEEPIRAFQIPEKSTAPKFRLADDLEELLAVHSAKARRATVFCCARILEALTQAALEKLGLESSGSQFADLDTLQQYNQLPTTTRYWAHALRRYGNSARHIEWARINARDADLCLLFLEQWLDWFFCRFRFGLGFATLTREDPPLLLCNNDELRRFLTRLDDAVGRVRVDLNSILQEQESLLFESHVLPALVAEILLDQGRHEDADAVLHRGLGEYPGDLRLRQLRGLYYKRTGRLQEALPWTEINLQVQNPDDEADGIYAGVRKALWQRHRADPAMLAQARDWLEQALDAYLRGWKRSKHKNAYLGINVAFTLLLLGRPEKSRAEAGRVRELLEKRAERIDPERRNPDLAYNYWDRVSLAEAHLLLANLAEARRIYRDSFVRHADQKGNHKVTLSQIGLILEALGHNPNVEAFFACPLAELTTAPFALTCEHLAEGPG